MAYVIIKYAHETNCKLHWYHFLPMCMIFDYSLVPTGRENTIPCKKLNFCQRGNLKIAPEEELRLYDVSALFISVPVSKALVIIKERLVNDITLKTELLFPQMILQNYWSYALGVHIFLFKISTIYKSKVFPWALRCPQLFATCIWRVFERRALESAMHPACWWKRYVDDST